jgi:hypothetical protein
VGATTENRIRVLNPFLEGWRGPRLWDGGCGDWAGKDIFGTSIREHEGRVDHGLPRGSPKKHRLRTTSATSATSAAAHFVLLGNRDRVREDVLSTDGPKKHPPPQRRVCTPILFERSEGHTTTQNDEDESWAVAD